MEIDGVKTGKQPKMRCVFCKRWSELDPATWNDLEAEPCPNCGETGSDVRALQEKVKGCAQSQSQLPQGAGRGLRLSGSSPVAGEDGLLIGGLSVLSAAEVSL